MRLLPRMHIPKIKLLKRKLRQWRRHLTVARAVFISELLLLAGALLLVYSGSRSAMLDRMGSRADLAALVLIFVLFGLLRVLDRRRIVPALERRFSPAPYDERRILFDLGQEARTATDTDHLYRSIISRIGDALEAENVSVFARDDASGNFLCRISSAQAAANEADEQHDKEKAAAQPQLMLSRNAFVVRRLQNMANPLVIEPAELDSWDRALSFASQSAREARSKERETLLEIKSSLLVRIKIKEQLIGILSLGPRRGGYAYSSTDKEMLMSVAGQLAFVIENSKLVERMMAEERLRRELALAAEVQQRLFPARPPASEAIELAGFCQPARGVGGDYYDFLKFDNQQIGIAVADVAGKGISAALLMSSVQASLRSQAMTLNTEERTRFSLAEMVSTMNRLLCGSTGSATYVTFFYAQFDVRTRQLTYVNAGHNPPMLFRAQQDRAISGEPDLLAISAPGCDSAGEIIRDVTALAGAASESITSNGDTANGCFKLTTGGPVIGMFEHCLYEQETIQLDDGDLLVAYTDGVTEALNREGEEFGEERMQEALTTAAHLSASEVRDAVVARVRAWCTSAPQHDDLTFIVVKVNHKPAEARL